MKIKISDERLRDRELMLEVCDFYAAQEHMTFSLDGVKYFRDFIVKAVGVGMVQTALKVPTANEWFVTMDIKYLSAMYYE